MLNNFWVYVEVIYSGWNLTLRFWDRGLLYAALTGTPDPSTSVRALAD